MEPSDTDEALMLRYRDGDARAFELLYARHKGPLYRYCVRLVRPAAVAEELFQDVWTNVIRARERYEVRAKFTTWLYRLAHNRMIDHYRRISTGVPLSDDEAAQDALDGTPAEAFREPDNEFEQRRLGQRLVEALATLPEPQREAFLLREEGGMSLEEIAETTGVSTEAAKSRLRYALVKLRTALAAHATPDRTGKNEQRK
jgi:RNA polymerase sigma-70 factor, ECF subfamily